MNKELIGILVLFIALFTGALYYSGGVQGPLISLLHTVKNSYYDSVAFISESIEEHFNQQQAIMRLRNEAERYKESHLMLHQFASQLNALHRENRSQLRLSPDVDLVRAISYAKFGDMNKVWIQMSDFNSSRVYGLTHQGYTAGIVVEKNAKPLALLNSDPKSSYAVYVGSDNAPGIVHGTNSDTMVVKFIPTWMSINEGDEVITSGLDKLFFTGIKVGKVLSVKRSQGFQSAVIKPYLPSTMPDYFHLIKRTH